MPEEPNSDSLSDGRDDDLADLTARLWLELRTGRLAAIQDMQRADSSTAMKAQLAEMYEFAALHLSADWHDRLSRLDTARRLYREVGATVEVERRIERFVDVTEIVLGGPDSVESRLSHSDLRFTYDLLRTSAGDREPYARFLTEVRSAAETSNPAEQTEQSPLHLKLAYVASYGANSLEFTPKMRAEMLETVDRFLDPASIGEPTGQTITKKALEAADTLFSSNTALVGLRRKFLERLVDSCIANDSPTLALEAQQRYGRRDPVSVLAVVRSLEHRFALGRSSEDKRQSVELVVDTLRTRFFDTAASTNVDRQTVRSIEYGPHRFALCYARLGSNKKAYEMMLAQRQRRWNPQDSDFQAADRLLKALVRRGARLALDNQPPGAAGADVGHALSAMGFSAQDAMFGLLLHRFERYGAPSHLERVEVDGTISKATEATIPGADEHYHLLMQAVSAVADSAGNDTESKALHKLSDLVVAHDKGEDVKSLLADISRVEPTDLRLRIAEFVLDMRGDTSLFRSLRRANAPEPSNSDVRSVLGQELTLKAAKRARLYVADDRPFNEFVVNVLTNSGAIWCLLELQQRNAHFDESQSQFLKAAVRRAAVSSAGLTSMNIVYPSGESLLQGNDSIHELQNLYDTAGECLRLLPESGMQWVLQHLSASAPRTAQRLSEAVSARRRDLEKPLQHAWLDFTRAQEVVVDLEIATERLLALCYEGGRLDVALSTIKELPESAMKLRFTLALAGELEERHHFTEAVFVLEPLLKALNPRDQFAVLGRLMTLGAEMPSVNAFGYREVGDKRQVATWFRKAVDLSRRRSDVPLVSLRPSVVHCLIEAGTTKVLLDYIKERVLDPLLPLSTNPMSNEWDELVSNFVVGYTSVHPNRAAVVPMLDALAESGALVESTWFAVARLASEVDPELGCEVARQVLTAPIDRKYPDPIALDMAWSGVELLVRNKDSDGFRAMANVVLFETHLKRMGGTAGHTLEQRLAHHVETHIHDHQMAEYGHHLYLATRNSSTELVEGALKRAIWKRYTEGLPGGERIFGMLKGIHSGRKKRSRSITSDWGSARETTIQALSARFLDLAVAAAGLIESKTKISELEQSVASVVRIQVRSSRNEATSTARAVLGKSVAALEAVTSNITAEDPEAFLLKLQLSTDPEARLSRQLLAFESVADAFGMDVNRAGGSAVLPAGWAEPQRSISQELLESMRSFASGLKQHVGTKQSDEQQLQGALNKRIEDGGDELRLLAQITAEANRRFEAQNRALTAVPTLAEFVRTEVELEQSAPARSVTPKQARHQLLIATAAHELGMTNESETLLAHAQNVDIDWTPCKTRLDFLADQLDVYARASVVREALTDIGRTWSVHGTYDNASLAETFGDRPFVKLIFEGMRGHARDQNRKGQEPELG